MDLDARASVDRQRAVGARRRAAPPVAAAARGRDRGARAARALGRRRAGQHVGEAFAAALRRELPQFAGPDGLAGEMTARYREWTRCSRRLRSRCDALALSARGGWRVRREWRDGPLTLELGRDDAAARLARFVAAHARTVGDACAPGHARSSTWTCATGTASRRACPAFAKAPDQEGAHEPARRSSTDDGEGQQEPDRRTRHRHVEDRRDRGRGRARTASST